MASVHLRGRIYHACMHIGAPKPVYETTGLTDRREAKRWANNRERELAEKYTREHPEVLPLSTSGAEDGKSEADHQPKPSQLEKSFRQRLEEVRDKRAKDGAWATSNIRQHTTVINLMARAMGDRINAVTSRLDVEDFQPVRAALNLEGNKTKGSGNYAGCIRRLLKPMIGHGLRQECYDVFASITSKGRKKASGRPFTSDEIRTLVTGVVKEADWLQGFVYGGLSGGAHIGDLVFLKWCEVKFNLRRIIHERIKTGVESEYPMLPLFYDWLTLRLHAPDDIYVFPEAVFSDDERQQPSCNKTPINEDERVEAVCGNRSTQFINFLKKLGIKQKGLSFKSFRQFAITFWSAIGIRTTTRMRMAGHIELNSHIRYDFPAEWEIQRAGELMDRYLKSILDGNPIQFPSTLFEIHEIIMAKLERLQGDVQSFRDIFHQEMLRFWKQEFEDGFKAMIRATVKESVREEFLLFKQELWQGLPPLVSGVVQNAFGIFEGRLRTLPGLGRLFPESEGEQPTEAGSVPVGIEPAIT